MKWHHAVLRVAVMAGIAIAFMVTIGFGDIARTFAIAACASLGSQAAVFAVQRLGGEAKVSAAMIAACVVIGAGAGAFAVLDARGSSGSSGPLRYRTVDEVMASPRDYAGAQLKLHGFVEIGSLRRGQDAIVFTLVEKDKRVRVELRGPAPETLADRAEVVATGRLRDAGAEGMTLFATELIAKCPSTYNSPQGPRPAAEFR